MTGSGQNENSVARSVSPSREGGVPTRTTPDDGDIVVREEKLEGTVVYVLNTLPVRTNTCLPTWEEAATQALTLAERHGICAMADDG